MDILARNPVAGRNSNNNRSYAALRFLRNDRARFSNYTTPIPISAVRVEQQRKSLVNKRYSAMMKKRSETTTAQANADKTLSLISNSSTTSDNLTELKNVRDVKDNERLSQARRSLFSKDVKDNERLSQARRSLFSNDIKDNERLSQARRSLFSNDIKGNERFSQARKSLFSNDMKERSSSAGRYSENAITRLSALSQPERFNELRNSVYIGQDIAQSGRFSDLMNAVYGTKHMAKPGLLNEMKNTLIKTNDVSNRKSNIAGTDGSNEEAGNRKSTTAGDKSNKDVVEPVKADLLRRTSSSLLQLPGFRYHKDGEEKRVSTSKLQRQLLTTALAGSNTGLSYKDGSYGNITDKPDLTRKSIRKGSQWVMSDFGPMLLRPSVEESEVEGKRRSSSFGARRGSTFRRSFRRSELVMSDFTPFSNRNSVNEDGNQAGSEARHSSRLSLPCSQAQMMKSCPLFNKYIKVVDHDREAVENVVPRYSYQHGMTVKMVEERQKLLDEAKLVEKKRSEEVHQSLLDFKDMLNSMMSRGGSELALDIEVGLHSHPTNLDRSHVNFDLETADHRNPEIHII